MTKVIPPNDPSRPCWEIFATLLSREIKVPDDPKAARDYLRSLLLETYELKPYALFRCAILTDANGAMASAFKAFLDAYNHEGRRISTYKRDLARPDHEDIADFNRKVSGAWAPAADYILSQWWSMGTGGGPARKQIYKDLGTTTNEPIRAWLPEKCGVVPYLRARTKHIMLDYYKGRAVADRMISLDFCSEYRLELTEEGKFVRNVEFQDDFDAGLAPEDIKESIEASSFEAVSAETIVSNIELDEPDPASAAMNREEAQYFERLESLRGTGETRPASYADWPLQLLAEEYNPKVGAKSIEYQRNHARILLEQLTFVDSDIKSDFPTLIEILEEWNGSPPLVEALPELCESAEKNGPSLLKHRETRQAPPDLFNLSLIEDRIQDLEESENAIDSVAIAIDQVGYAEMIGAETADYDLNSPERLDYIFLCQHTGTNPNRRLHGKELHEEMKRMAASFTQKIEAIRPGMEMLFSMSLNSWDPASQLFGHSLAKFSSMAFSSLSVAPPEQKPKGPEVAQAEFGF